MDTRLFEHWIVPLLLAVVAVMGVAFMPREIYPGDPAAMREETRAILLRGELAVSEVVAREYAQVGEIGQYVVANPRNGRTYSKYGSMAACFYLLPMGLEKIIEGDLPPFGSPRRVLYLNLFNVFLSLLLAASLYRTTRRFHASPDCAAAYVVVCFYTTFLWNYLRAQNSEIMQLLLFAWAVTAFLDVIQSRSGTGRDRTAVPRLWLACGALLLTKVAYLLVGPLFAIGLAVERKTRHGCSWLDGLITEAKEHLLPATVMVTAWLGLNFLKFGDAWKTGYHAWKPDIHGFNGNVFDGLYNVLFTAQWGLGFNFPILFLALPLMWRWLQREPVRYGTLLGICGIYLFLLGMLPMYRGELCYGPRYWLWVLPFVAMPAVEAFQWMRTGGRSGVFAFVVVTLCLIASTALQWQVNSYSFLAIYNLRAPIEQNMSLGAAEYLIGHSYGKILGDFRRAQNDLAELPWWKDMKTRLHVQDAEAYEKHVKDILRNHNWYWWD